MQLLYNANPCNSNLHLYPNYALNLMRAGAHLQTPYAFCMTVTTLSKHSMHGLPLWNGAARI